MRRPPVSVVLAAVIGLVLAACASPSGGVTGPSGGGEPSTAPQSEAPAESQPGGGGGGGGGGTGGSGSVTYEMSGGHSVSEELPFAGNFAYWQQAGVSFLVFTDDTDATEANGVIITLGADGANESNVFQYVTDDLVIPAADCDWTITQHDANGAAGSFSCTDQGGFSASGGPVLGINISGDFQASR
jgi:hypothetical protein